MLAQGREQVGRPLVEEQNTSFRSRLRVVFEFNFLVFVSGN